MARATDDRAKWWPGPRPVIFALAVGCLVTFLAFDLVMQDSVPLTGGLAAVLGGAVSLPGEAAEETSDVVAAVDFARNHRLRLVVKGGGHSYQDRSCSPDSLLVWTREMRDIALHDSESDFFQRDWQTAFWGANYPRFAAAKRRYDPEGLFFIHHGVGSEAWSADGFTPKTGR